MSTIRNPDALRALAERTELADLLVSLAVDTFLETFPRDGRVATSGRTQYDFLHYLLGFLEVRQETIRRISEMPPC